MKKERYNDTERNLAADEAIAEILRRFPGSGVVIVQLGRETRSVTVSANVDTNGLLLAAEHIAARIDDMRRGLGGH